MIIVQSPRLNINLRRTLKKVNCTKRDSCSNHHMGKWSLQLIICLAPMNLKCRTVRSDIEGIIKSYFPATPIPVSWLMFRIVLHLLNKPVVSLSQCENIAMQLSMPTPVKEALWFFHHNVGSLMYYSDISSMEDIVICDPQVIFDSISKLIIDKFKRSNRALKPREVEDFHEKGQFSLSHIRDKTECQHTSHLKLNQLTDLLKPPQHFWLR